MNAGYSLRGWRRNRGTLRSTADSSFAWMRNGGHVTDHAILKAEKNLEVALGAAHLAYLAALHLAFTPPRNRVAYDRKCNVLSRAIHSDELGMNATGISMISTVLRYDRLQVERQELGGEIAEDIWAAYAAYSEELGIQDFAISVVSAQMGAVYLREQGMAEDADSLAHLAAVISVRAVSVAAESAAEAHLKTRLISSLDVRTGPLLEMLAAAESLERTRWPIAAEPPRATILTELMPDVSRSELEQLEQALALPSMDEILKSMRICERDEVRLTAANSLLAKGVRLMKLHWSLFAGTVPAVDKHEAIAKIKALVAIIQELGSNDALVAVMLDAAILWERTVWEIGDLQLGGSTFIGVKH